VSSTIYQHWHAKNARQKNSGERPVELAPMAG